MEITDLEAISGAPLRGKQEKFRIMYKGYVGDQGSPFEYRGLSFKPRIVQPVSKDVFEVFSQFRSTFIVIDGVKETVIDWPRVGSEWN